MALVLSNSLRLQNTLVSLIKIENFMKIKCCIFLISLFFASGLQAQVTILEKIGQTPGGAGYHVNWDSLSMRLIVGCGTSIWIYDMSDTANIHVIARRPLLGLVNETELYNDVLFVAATHDGLYALDATSDSLTVLAHYDMQEMGSEAAYDIWRTNDTIYLADNNNVRILKYSDEDFTHLETFGPPSSFCVTRRGNQIAIGSQGLQGKITVYDSDDITTPVASWQSSKIWYVQDLQFADLSDDIIYVCGGPENILFTKSDFFTLQLSENTLTAIDSFSVAGGIPGIAQLNIMNMDSRNDTLFVVTTAAYELYTLPYTYMPILDASGLPEDTLTKIGYVIPGFWHFDAALMDGTPFIAMSSEWLGVVVSDISQLQPFDTLGLLETGGWCSNSRLFGDTLWACHEGYGISAYILDSLYYRNGYMNESMIFHIFTQFVNDFDFLNDSLIILNTSEVYNLQPWYEGGNPEFVYDMNKGFVSIRSVQTNVGQRVVTGFDNLLGTRNILLYDPYDSIGGFPELVSESVANNVMSLTISGDTLYYGKKIDNQYWLNVVKIENDSFIPIDTIDVAGEINSISVEEGIIAIGCGKTIAWYQLNESTLINIGAYFDWYLNAVDIELNGNLIYVADKMYGMKLFDISQPPTATLVAESRGTGGWGNIFGSTAISVANDGEIYLSDFHAGVIIIEAYDTIPTNINQHAVAIENHKIKIYPNPSSNYIILKTDPEINFEDITLTIYDILGKEIKRMARIKSEETKIETLKFPAGIYFVSLTEKKKIIASAKFVVE